MADNRARILGDVVSLDVWHQAFSNETPKVALHVDVAFRTSKVGAEAESPVRFELGLKKAELAIVLPEHEPAAIDPSSISRDTPKKERGTRKRKYAKHQSKKAKGKFGTQISPKGIKPKASAGVGFELGEVIEESAETRQKIETISVTQSKDTQGNYRWEIESESGTPLQGHPWNADSAPRLKIIDTRTDKDKGIAPVVRAAVRCLREDLDIKQIEAKDPKIFEQIMEKLGFRNRMAAAEAYIRQQLEKEGLYFSDISEKYSALELANVSAQEIQK